MNFKDDNIEKELEYSTKDLKYYVIVDNFLKDSSKNEKVAPFFEFIWTAWKRYLSANIDPKYGQNLYFRYQDSYIIIKFTPNFKKVPGKDWSNDINAFSVVVLINSLGINYIFTCYKSYCSENFEVLHWKHLKKDSNRTNIVNCSYEFLNKEVNKVPSNEQLFDALFFIIKELKG